MINYSAEEIRANNEIIGYYNGKAIIRDDWGRLFFTEMEEEFVVLGDIVETKYISSIEELPQDEQKAIIELVE